MNPPGKKPSISLPDSSKVELVLFDYGQVLSTPPDPTAWSHMQNIATLSGEQLHQSYWALRDDYDRGAFIGPEYWRAVGKHAGVSFDETQVEALLKSDIDLWAQPNSQMIEWASRLQHARVRTAILSNIGDAMATGLSEQLPWLQLFEHRVWSYALRLAKPDQAIFRATIETLRLEPARILFIDDKQENVRVAQSLGMQAIQYSDHAAFERSMHDRALSWLLQVGATASSKVNSNTSPAESLLTQHRV